MSEEGGAAGDVIAQCEAVLQKNEAALKVGRCMWVNYRSTRPLMERTDWCSRQRYPHLPGQAGRLLRQIEIAPQEP